MTDVGCSGGCCAVFWLPKEIGASTVDGEFIRDMRIELTAEQAKERWATFVGTDCPTWVGGTEERPAYTCRHWDESTRLCTVYDQRPAVCRDYPYADKCSHGCSYQVDEETQSRYRPRTDPDEPPWVWDETAKGWRVTANDKWDWDGTYLRAKS